MRQDSPLTSTARGVVAATSTLAIVALIAVAGTLLGAGGVTPAWADGPEDCPGNWDPTTQACIQVSIPGPTQTPNPTGGTGGGTDKCYDGDTEVPCTKDGMSWFESHLCYAAPMQPQPPANHAAWAGHTPAEGTIYMCSESSPMKGPCGSFDCWFVGGGLEPVDGAAVARQLMVTIPYELADAKIAPPPTYHTYISYKNWLWIESSQWHSVSQSRSLRGATVTLTASPSYVEWDMGNEDTVSCVGAGRAWAKGMPENAPTNCSYAYEEMENPEGDTWTVSARISYTLSWTCEGNCGGATSGDLGSQLAAAGDSTTITVYQRQTVNKNGG